MSILSKLSKAVCIGRNYADHAKELGNSVPTHPMFFIKPPSSVLRPGMGPILRPKGVELHYELELAVVIGKKLQNCNPETFDYEKAQEYIAGYALGLDLTARNLQSQAKNKGLPWTAAKGFDTFLPLSDLIGKEKVPDPQNAVLKLLINGKVRQNDSTSLMIFKIPQLMAFVSNIMTLEPGDVLLTGTPKGVGEIVPGDKLHGELLVDSRQVGELEVDVAERPGYYQLPA